MTTQNRDCVKQGGSAESKPTMTHKSKSLYYRASSHATGGFTLIELMIVIAIIAIILSLALPVYSNYSIRAKVSECLSVANSAVTAVSATCVENRNIPSLNNNLAGYEFIEGSEHTDYVQGVAVSGPGTNPVITITSKNTWQTPAPRIIMTGELIAGSGQVQWNCSSDNTPNWLLPNVCRS